MKYLFLVLLLTSTASQAESLSATVYGASNYIYRGVSFSSNNQPYASQGQPVLQGSLDYLGDQGLSASLFTGNVDSFNKDTLSFEKDQEVDVFLSYIKPWSEDLVTSVGVNRFQFLKNSTSSMNEVAASVSYKIVKLDVSHSPNYSNIDSSLTYSKISSKIPLTNNFLALAHVGYSAFSQGPLVDSDLNYLDYRLGVGIVDKDFSLEISYTNTLNRKDAFSRQVENKDQAMSINFSKTFGIFSK